MDKDIKYSNWLKQDMKKEIKKIKWYSTDMKLPKDGSSIVFMPTDSSLEFKGLYIKSEKLFFIGFEEAGEFYYYNQIAFWKYMEIAELRNNNFPKTKNKVKVETINKIWYVKVSVEDSPIFFEFKSQVEQLNFLEQIKGSVQNCVYALNSVEMAEFNLKNN